MVVTTPLTLNRFLGLQWIMVTCGSQNVITAFFCSSMDVSFTAMMSVAFFFVHNGSLNCGVIDLIGVDNVIHKGVNKILLKR